MPISMPSAPDAAAARTASSQPGIAAGDVRHEQLAPGGPRRAEVAPSIHRLAEQIHGLGDVLVAAPGHAHEHRRSRQRRRLADDPGDGVGRLEGAQDPLRPGQQGERVEHLARR